MDSWLCCWYSDDVESHQLVLNSMPILLTMFTSRESTTTQITGQLLRTLSLVCHRNRVAQVSIAIALCLSVSPSVCLSLSVCLQRCELRRVWGIEPPAKFSTAVRFTSSAHTGGPLSPLRWSSVKSYIRTLTLWPLVKLRFLGCYLRNLNSELCNQGRDVYPAKANPPKFHPLFSFFPLPFLSSFHSLPVSSPFHSPSHLPPQVQLGGLGSAVSFPSGVGDASTGLKTHLVAASFSFHQLFLWRKMRHSRLGLDAPWTKTNKYRSFIHYARAKYQWSHKII